MKSEKLQAVLDEDIEGLLRSIGKLDNILAGEIVCRFCGDLVTLQNLQAILPLSGGDFWFICNKPSCIERLSSEAKVPN